MCDLALPHFLYLKGNVSPELLKSVKTSEKMGHFRESDSCTGMCHAVIIAQTGFKVHNGNVKLFLCDPDSQL